MKFIAALFSLVSVGFIAGLFFTWANAVMPGMKQLNDINFIAAMKAMNKEIQNLYFFLLFFGALICPVILLLLQDRNNADVSWYLLLFSISIYTVGVLLITIIGNVPLNENLDKFNCANATPDEMKAIRKSFEYSWNRLNLFRAVSSGISFILLILHLHYSPLKS